MVYIQCYVESMIKAKVLAEALNRMVTSEVGKEARIQVKVNNQILDIVSMQMLENRLIGVRETHRIVLEASNTETAPMGKPIRSKGKLIV